MKILDTAAVLADAEHRLDALAVTYSSGHRPAYPSGQRKANLRADVFRKAIEARDLVRQAEELVSEVAKAQRELRS